MRFRRFRPALVAGLLASAPAALPAQEEVRVTVTDRGRIGILVDTERDADSLGARVADVIEDGPAEKAGLRAGDVITSWNGTTLSSGPGRDPGHRLLRMARRLAPGDTVKIAYRRGSETRTASIVADDKGQHVMAFPGRMGRHFDRMGDHFDQMGSRLGREFDFHVHRRRGGLELVELNRDLGEYFGTNEGLLVVRAPADSAIPLKAGDVIMAIDGRKPQSAGHAHRILGSYQDGEKAKVEVLRQRKRTTLEWSVPERDRWRDRPSGNRPERRRASGWS